MDARITVAQITGAISNPESPNVLKVTKPQTNQAISIHLDGTSKLDLTAVGNEHVTYVHVGDHLVILFDNHSTVTIQPFYNSNGLPLADITVALGPDRDVSGVEFASLFPITTDLSVLPAAGGSPPSGGHFETVITDQFANNPVPLALLGSDAPTGNGPTNANISLTFNTMPGPTLGVHDVGGNEDKPIALNIIDFLSNADPRALLGNLTISGVPAGATLSAGTHNADGSWTLTPAQLVGLTLSSDGEVQHFTLTVAGTASVGPIIGTSTATLHVDVTPVADQPTLSLGNLTPIAEGAPHIGAALPGPLVGTVFGLEDKPIALSIKAALGEVDADAVLSVTISGIPAGVALSAGTHNADGSVTLTPAQLAGLTLTSDGEAQHFDLTVRATVVDGGDTATSASTTGTFHVSVTPVPEAPTLALPNETSQSSFSFSKIDVPGAIVTEAFGIDGKGTVVGTFFDSSFAQHAFVDKAGSFSQFDVGNVFTEATGINGNGDFVGAFFDNNFVEHGFLLTQTGTFSQIDVKGAAATLAFGINNSDEIVGRFVDGSGKIHGFSEQNGAVTQIDVSLPGDTSITATRALGVNDNGQIVGLFDDKAGEHGFVDTNGMFKAIDISGATKTNARGIDDKGDIVGVFDDAKGEHGFFLDASGNLTVLDGPGSTFTDALGINASGQITGFFGDSTGTHGFTATATAPVLTGHVSGNEDKAIALGINAALGEIDKDAVLTVITISGLPTAGVTLSNANHDVLTISPDGSIKLTPAQLAGLTLTGDGENSSFDLTVTATTVDGGDTATAASATETLHVDVTPVADAPIFPTIPAFAFGAPIDVPGKALARANGINDAGEVVGTSQDSNNNFHGFILQPGGTPTNIDVPFAHVTSTQFFGVNSSGAIVGTFNDNTAVDQGFIDQGGTFSRIKVPGSDSTDAFGINDAGDIVGRFANHGFLDHGGVFTTIDVSGVTFTQANGINDAGDIVGIFFDDKKAEHGFLLKSGATNPTTIDVPGASVTQAFGINASGEIVGLYADSNGHLHGFLDQGGVFTTIDPAKSISTEAFGINDAGLIVGEFSDGNIIHGFQATPNGSGAEDTPIGLNIPVPTLSEADADAVVTVTITGLPTSGVTLSNANHDVLTISPDGSITLTPAQLAGLTLTGDGENSSFDLTVTATTVDGGDTATAASATQTLHVNVTPVADAPIFPTIPAVVFGQTIDVPGEALARANGINDAGEIVGTSQDSNNNFHGFILQPGGAPVIVNVPFTGVTQTQFFGVNSSGAIVGTFNDNTAVDQGFIDQGGTFSRIKVLGSDATDAFGINDAGDIVGRFALNGNHGFLDHGGVFTPIDVPGATFTQANGINDAGDIVGIFFDDKKAEHGFLLKSGATNPTTIDVPGAIVTQAFGINTSGEIVGLYADSNGHFHGFLDQDGVFTTIDPAKSISTEAFGINDAGVIVGEFSDGRIIQGFEATATGVTGAEGAPIALNIPVPTHSEADADAVLTITISGLPSGVTLSDANHDPLTIANGTATLTTAELNGLSLTSATAQHFELTVTVTNTDGGDTSTAASTPPQHIHVEVAPILLFAADHTTVLGTFTTIQGAVDAAKAPGEFIDIGSGTYREQVIVDPTHGHGANGLTIEGVGPAGSVILDAPAASSLQSVVTPATPEFTSENLAGVLTVSNATNVTIQGLTVNGQHTDVLPNSTDFAGIAFVNANGTVDHVDVTGVSDTAPLFGLQRGFGIEAENATGGGTLTVTNSSVEDFQKGGIVTDNLIVDFNHDTFTGAGATSVIAQNAIQVSDASGEISNNTFNGIGFVQTPADTTDQSTDVLFFHTQNLTLDNNTINGALDSHGNPVADIGIAGLNSSGITINGNQISNVQEAILGQEDANFSGGVFAPPWSIGNFNVVVNATQQGLDFEVAANDTQSFNIVGTKNGNDLFVGGAGHDMFTSGGSGNDTFVYNVANQGTQASIGGTGTDTEIVNGTTTATTYNINAINGGSELGIHIESGIAPANVVAATAANAEVTTQAIEEIAVNLGNAGDKVIITGDLSGTGVATHTITINGGTGDDTVDLTKLASNEDVNFNGGGHGANGDTAILGFAFGAGTYQSIFDAGGNLIGVNITHTSADGPVTDTFTNLQNFTFTDGTRSLIQLFPPTLTVAPATVNEDGTVALNITDVLSQVDPHASLGNVTISGVPDGVTFNSGMLSGGTLTLTPNQLSGLTMTVPDSDQGNFTLTVSAATNEGGQVATASANLSVTVNAVPDAPTLSASAAANTVNEDGAVALTIHPQFEADPDAVNMLTVTGLAGTGATLNHGTVNPADGSVTLQQSDLGNLFLIAADGDTSNIHLIVQATSSEGGLTATAQQTIDLAVNQVPETPTLTATAAASNVLEGGTVALNISSTFEADPDAKDTITISGLIDAKGNVIATLNHGTVNSDGSVTLTSDQLAGLTLTAPDNGETSISLHVTATASEGGTSAVSVATVNLAVAPILLQAVQLPGDEAAFNIVPVTLDSDTTLQSLTIGGLPQNEETSSTNFELLDSKGNSIPFSGVTFPLSKFATAVDADNASATISDPTELQNVLANGLQLVELDRSGNQVSLDGQTFTLTLNASESDNDSPNDKGAAVTSSSTFTLETAPAADAPVIVTHDVTGVANAAIPLTVSALTEVDPDETVTLFVSGLPGGATLASGGVTLVPIPDSPGVFSLTPDQLSSLTLTSDGSNKHFDLSFNATATEGGTSASATSATLHVDIVVATDANPVLVAKAAATSINEDGTVALSILAAPADATVTISGLVDANNNVIATLNHGTPNSDGSVTLQESDLTGLTLHAVDGDTSALHLSVTATTNNGGTLVNTAPQTIDLPVNPVPETPTLTATAAASNVLEGGTVALNISSTFEADPDAVNTITVTGLNGAMLNHGTVNSDGSVTLTPDQLAGLTLTAPDNGETSISLLVTANASEGAGPAANSTVATINLAVAPILLQGVQLLGDEAVFNIVPVSSDPDATLTSVQISGFPVNLLNETTSSVLTDAHGNNIHIDATGSTGIATFTAAQIQAGILNGLQLNLAEGASSPTLTLIANASDGGAIMSSSSTFTFQTLTPAADAPVIVTHNVTGTANLPILLPVSVLTEVDPDETVSLFVSGLPSGATLSSGGVTLVPNTLGAIPLTPDQLPILMLTSDGSNSSFDLTFSGFAQESSPVALASAATLHVDIKVANDANPVVVASAAATSVNEDGTVGLTIVAAPADATVTVAGLGTATLNHGTVNADGSVTLHQSDLAGLTLRAGDDDTSAIHFTVIATTNNGGTLVNTAQTVDLTVNPVAEKPTVSVSAPNEFPDPQTNITSVSVNENGTVALNISPKFENDPDAVNTVTISGLAGTGATLNHGTFNATTGNWTLQQSDLVGLTLTAPDTQIAANFSGSNLNILQLQVTANTQDVTSSASSTTAQLNVDVAPFVAQGVQIHTDDTDKFKLVVPQSDSDATLQSITINGIPVNVSNEQTPFEILDSNGKSLSFNQGFVFAPGAGGPLLNDASVTISDPTEIQSAITNGLQLVEINGSNNPVSLEGQIFNLTLSTGSVDGGITSSSSTPFKLGIAETPTLSTPGVSGMQGASIALTVNASTGETDTADTALSVILSGLPTGVSLSNTKGDTLTINNGSIKLTPAQLAGLALTSDGEDQHFNLAVTATAIDNGNAATAATATSSLHVDVTPTTNPTQVAAQFDSVTGALDFNNHTIETNTTGQTIQLIVAGSGVTTLNASGNHFIADGSSETLDFTAWDRAVEINFAAGTIRLDANTVTPSGSISGFANVLGTVHNDFFDNLTGGVTVTGGAGAVDHFSLAANVLDPTSVPTITNFNTTNEAIDLSALLDAKFGPGSDPTKASNFVKVQEDASGNSATLEINVNGTSGGAFVAAAHLSGIHAGDLITAILDHAHSTAQLHAF